MARYIDAEKVKHGLFGVAVTDDSYGMAVSHGIDIALKIVNDTPTADVVEVVRCKDCKHIAIINNSKLYAKCEKTNYEFNPFETDTRSHFCSYGERRDT